MRAADSAGCPAGWGAFAQEGDTSYLYLGYAIRSEYMLESDWLAPIALGGALASLFANPDDDATITHPALGDTTIYRLREGIERFFISDINNAAATAMAQSELAVYWDIVATEVEWFNHIPGGCNVLFMDGHVEFIKYPSDTFPVTEFFAEVASLNA